LAAVQEVYRQIGLWRLDNRNVVGSILRILLEAHDPWQQPPAAVAYTQQTYQDLRIAYIESKISKAEWASKLSHKETLRIKKSRLRTIFDTFLAVSTDLFNEFYAKLVQQTPTLAAHEQRPRCEEAVGTFVRAFETLRAYYNSELRRILSDYSDTSIRVLMWGGPADRPELMWLAQGIHVPDGPGLLLA